MNSSNTNKRLKEKTAKLPQVPGSYVFKDKDRRVIYVGKANNLRSRVGSYFRIDIETGSKTAALVSKINDIEFIEVASEFEALILEAELIKKYKPHYNIVLKDDRSYLYIVIRDEIVKISGKKNKLPRVITARKTEILKGDVTFGPFPNATVVKSIFRILREVVPFRDCSVGKFTRYERLSSACLWGHLGVCPAPCTTKDVTLYRKNITYVKKILLGKVPKLILELESEMKNLSRQQDFEKAAEYRNLLSRFSYLKQGVREAEEYIDNPYLVEDLNKKALEEIKGFLNLKETPNRIECYDISNISGKEAVGSMVVATKGKIDKKEYRRFKVKFKKTPDDFSMMYEILSRRLKRGSHEVKGITRWPDPDLIIVDGGAPQVSAVSEVLKELNLNIPLVGLAKKFETLIQKDGDGFKNLKFSEEKEGMKLIIRLRNESHRFAQRYHHLLRSKSLGV